MEKLEITSWIILLMLLSIVMYSSIQERKRRKLLEKRLLGQELTSKELISRPAFGKYDFELIHSIDDNGARYVRLNIALPGWREGTYMTKGFALIETTELRDRLNDAIMYMSEKPQ